MKFLKNKSIFQKIIIAILIIIAFGFIFSATVNATTAVEGFGSIFGDLIKPIISFIRAIEDIIMDFVHVIVVSQNNAGIWANLSTQTWVHVVCFVLGLVVALISIAILGAIGAFATSAISSALTAFGVSGIITAGTIPAGLVLLLSINNGKVAGRMVGTSLVGDSVYLPLYSVSPENIFSGKMAVLDVDFFNPNPETRTTSPRETLMYSYHPYAGGREVIENEDFNTVLEIARDRGYLRGATFRRSDGRVVQLEIDIDPSSGAHIEQDPESYFWESDSVSLRSRYVK